MLGPGEAGQGPFSVLVHSALSSAGSSRGKRTQCEPGQ